MISRHMSPDSVELQLFEAYACLLLLLFTISLAWTTTVMVQHMYMTSGTPEGVIPTFIGHT
jgi:hypothetical protein